MDIRQVAEISAKECERQQVGLQELIYLLDAYRIVSGNRMRMFVIQADFVSVGRMVEPVKNRNGFRTTPVTFRNGGSAAHWESIPRLMMNLCGAIEQYTMHTPEDDPEGMAREIVRQFLWIHPFADGNGRVGYLLWNYLGKTLDYPLALPDFGW